MVRKYIYILLVILTIFAYTIKGEAVVTDRELSFGRELEIPLDFSFSKHEHCSGHSYYHRAIAQDDGAFAVFSHYIDQQGRNPETFSRQYIDIYHSDGSFAKEFSFCTQQTYAPILENNKLYLYFYSYVITIDVDTEEMHCYDTDDVYINERNDVVVQQPKTFAAGSWEYDCKGSLSGYNTLTRSDGATEQVVVEMSGRVRPFGFYIGGALGAAVIIAIGLFVKRHKKNRKTYLF